jgi:hypothetical protein
MLDRKQHTDHHQRGSGGSPTVAAGKRTLTSSLPASCAGAPAYLSAADAAVDVANNAGTGTVGSPHEDPFATHLIGGGTALPASVRSLLEPAFGLDLSGVRVHQDGVAEAHGAQALARGRDLHFAPGAFDPASQAGRELIGHEVAHVAQQTAGRATAGTQAKGGGGIDESPGLEREADELGARAARGERDLLGVGADSRRSPAASSVIQRRPTTWDQIGTNKKGDAKWKPHKTQPIKSDKAQPETDLEGLGAHVENTVDVKHGQVTDIKYASVGLIKSATATIGPHHPVGGKISSSYTQADDLDDNAQDYVPTKPKKVVRPTPYEAVQLLPRELGGSGHGKNLTALPPSVAATLRDEFHARLITLVDTNRAWITASVKVTEAADPNDKKLFYPKTVNATWMELDANGNAKNKSKGEVNIAAPAPSAYGGAGTAATSDLPATTASGKANRALVPKAGFRRRAKTAVEFATRIHFGATHSPTKDGTSMEAEMLGPDHRIGEEPGDGVWSKRTQEMRVAAGTTGDRQSYVAGHLLNHHIGGPGNDSRNLAPIPRDANQAHEAEVENHVKRLVNIEKAWVYYKVEVQHAKDPVTTTLTYPSAFVCTWHQLDEYGEKVANTGGDKTINIKAPSAYKTNSTATDHGSELQHGTLSANTAHTRLAYDEVLLDDNETLKHQRKVMTPLILKIRQLGLNGFFTHDPLLASSVEAALSAVSPAVPEKHAREEIDKLAVELNSVAKDQASLEKLAPKLTGDLKTHLQTLGTEVQKRHTNGLAGAKALLDVRYTELRAGELFDELQKAVGFDADVVRSTYEAGVALIKFIDLAVTQGKEHRKGLTDAANKLRIWLGAKPADDKLDGDGLGKDVLASVKSGHDHLKKFVDNPGSPMQTLDFCEIDTGVQEQSSIKAKDRIVTSRLDIEKADGAMEIDMSTKPKHGYADKMLTAMTLDGTLWPKPPSSVTGFSATFAQTMEMLAPQAAINQPMVKLVLDSLYQTETRAFSEYVKWLMTTKVSF